MNMDKALLSNIFASDKYKLYNYFTKEINYDYSKIVPYVVEKDNLFYIPIAESIIDESHKHNTQHIPLSICGTFKAHTEENRRIIAGYASVVEVDSHNDLITKEVLEDAINTLLSNEEYANLMLKHQNIQVGKIIREFGDCKTHVDDEGFYIVAEIRNDLESANVLWQDILDGKLNGFSIAGEVILSHDECDSDKCVRVIDKMNMFEVSVCHGPVSKRSGFIILSKSDDECLCDVNIENEEKQMTKEEDVVSKDEDCVDCKAEDDTQEQPLTENKSEEPEISVKDQLDSILRDIEAMKGTLSELVKADDEEEEEIEEEEEEEELSKSEDEPETETKSEDEEPQTVSKEDFDAFKESVQSTLERLSKINDLEMALKAKDDEVRVLQRQVEIVNKSDDEPQEDTPEVKQTEESTPEPEVKEQDEPETTVKEPEPEPEPEPVKTEEPLPKPEVKTDTPEVAKTQVELPEGQTEIDTSSDTPTDDQPFLVQDKIQPGVFWKDPDL